MATSVKEQQVRPRAMWDALPTVMFVVAIGLVVVAIVTIAHIVNADIDRVPGTASGDEQDEVGSVSVPSGGFTLYTTTQDSDATCSLQPAGDGQAVELESFSFGFEVPHGGRAYYGVGVTPESLAPGEYSLVCSETVAGDRFSTGPRIDTTALATRFIWGLALPLVLVAVGIVILIILLVKRHRSKARLTAMQPYGAPGYGEAWKQTHGSGGPPPPPPAT